MSRLALIALFVGVTSFACGGNGNSSIDGGGSAADASGTAGDGGGSAGDGGGSAIDANGATADGGPTVDANANLTCMECAQTSCSSELTACQADTDCNCTFDCLANGGNEGQCKQSCGLAGNNAPWADMITCIDSMCAGNC